MTEVLDGLDRSGRHVLPVFITIDPSRDTPERLRSYFADHDFHKRTIPLTGSHEALQAKGPRSHQHTHFKRARTARGKGAAAAALARRPSHARRPGQSSCPSLPAAACAESVPRVPRLLHATDARRDREGRLPARPLDHLVRRAPPLLHGLHHGHATAAAAASTTTTPYSTSFSATSAASVSATAPSPPLDRYLIDPEGHFLEFFGKSLSRQEMETKMAKCIDEWESAKWWEKVWAVFGAGKEATPAPTPNPVAASR